ncbi:hypothetical protein SAMN05444166_0970 [Singulisphaera sp. GP187]|uniref:hypothetical protein n=1 Tax=Singulisphaera sp. GP187 TaxID=1882752 RepID=UPI00092BF947|nr:hypothetical protein [Singulisphaera sp. GP187]SIN80501.1 hypothetical protein SAMN05444166_0970 [Singulisphaera sp. GP187]
MNLLERTRRLLRGLTPASPAKVQYYSVACPEGHRLRGERTEGYQALRCPTCGEGIFVLPRSPLPEPVAAESAREAQAARSAVDPEREDEPVRLSDPIQAPRPPEATDVDGEIEWVDSDSTPTEEGSESGKDSDFFDSLSVSEQEAQRQAGAERRTTGSQKTPGSLKDRHPAGAPRTPQQNREGPRIAVAPRQSVGDWARRRRNPLLFLAVALIVTATVGFRVWRSKFQDLPRVVEIAREQGLAALDAGDFDTAHQLLSEGKRAVDALGGAVEGAAEVRHGAEEAAIFTTLAPEPLEQILVEASADANATEWSSRFSTFYKGRSFFLDSTVRAVPDATGTGSYDLDYRIVPNGEGSYPNLRVGRIDLTGFQLFELTHPKVGDRVQFGARLASLTRVNKEWLVGLEPESGVFLTHPRALEAIGRPAPEEASGEALP